MDALGEHISSMMMKNLPRAPATFHRNSQVPLFRDTFVREMCHRGNSVDTTPYCLKCAESSKDMNNQTNTLFVI